MSEACDLCGNAALEPEYTPDRSTRGLKVYVCTHCGLIQSLPRVDRAPRRAMAVSAGADWGNLRYGKGFRVADHMRLLKRYADPAKPFTILDVGANRGAFFTAVLKAFPKAHVTAVEPDERVNAYAADPRLDPVPLRIEETNFAEGKFDLLYSSHTLEHLKSPRETLAQHWRVLKPDGLLLLEVPNVALIGTSDIVEEWFIDKHLFHFSAVTLIRLLRATGFAIVEGPARDDLTNLTIVARKAEAGETAAASDPREVEGAESLIAAYADCRARNLRALKAAARAIDRMSTERVAIWGAGRLFNCLMTEGGLNPRAVAALVDKHIPGLTAEVCGVPVLKPAELMKLHPGVIVVMSRSFADEIMREAETLAPDARLITFAELLGAAHGAARALDLPQEAAAE